MVTLFVTTFSMLWEILWALLLGFLISAIIQVVVSKERLNHLLGNDSPKALAWATLLGAASSSCSYAAVTIARSLVRKGANFTAAMAFQFASTNLVIEIGVILILLLGWQFALAELIGGILMIVLLALIFRLTLPPRLIVAAHAHAEPTHNDATHHQGHDDHSASTEPPRPALISHASIGAIRDAFVMDVSMVWKDIILGLLIAGAIATWVPNSVWQSLLFVGHGNLSTIWGALLGPVIAIATFVCSIGNLPLAAVLWAGGISFAGVISFIFADLLILPILHMYRRYYGRVMTTFLFVSSYVAIVGAALLTDWLFRNFHLIPVHHPAKLVLHGSSFTYTSVLNILFLLVVATLILRPTQPRSQAETAHHQH